MKRQTTLKGIGSTSIFLTIFLLFTSCGTTLRYDVEPDVLQEIYSTSVKAPNNLNKDVDLYIDYSTCVVDAVANSVFFGSIRGRISGSEARLYAVKEGGIEYCCSDMDAVNTALTAVKEDNYAEIKGAIETIAQNNNQAILITDGEYWTRGIGERKDLPYMKKSFMKWLTKGYVIYIVIEPYSENGHAKKRYYFFFTDDKINNNIDQEIRKADGFDATKVKFFKLTNSDLQIIRNTSVDDNLEFTVDTTNSFDYIEIINSWDDLFEYVVNARDDEGNTIANGNPLIKNIKLGTRELRNFTIEDIDLKAYNVTEVYLDSLHSNDSAIVIPDGFEIDKELFMQKGEIAIKGTEKLRDYLFEEKENLLRIDIVLSKVENKPVNREWFTWRSLSGSGENTSVYISIKQTLDHPDISPTKRNGGIIHTIFLKTNEY